MIIGTLQKLFRREKCPLLLCLDDRQLKQTQGERLLGLDINPSLSWSSQVANLLKLTVTASSCSGSHKKIITS